MSKEWTGGRTGLRYRFPSIVHERQRNLTSGKHINDHLKGIKVPTHPAFPMEELSRYLTEEQNDGKN